MTPYRDSEDKRMAVAETSYAEKRRAKMKVWARSTLDLVEVHGPVGMVVTAVIGLLGVCTLIPLFILKVILTAMAILLVSPLFFCAVGWLSTKIYKAAVGRWER